MPIIRNDTFSSIVNLVNRANSDSVVQPPLPRGSFALDASGVAGFFGGDTAVRAMATVCLIPQRRWLGWYNASGAYEVAKQYSGIVKSYMFDALFPGGDGDPGKIFTVVDRQVGRQYIPLHSPTGKAPSSIGPLGLLIARKVLQTPITKDLPPQTEHTVEIQVETIADSQTHTTDRLRITFIGLNPTVSGRSAKPYLFPSMSDIFAIATILISVGGCIACALVGDWFCFPSIAIGIIANGVACSVIGSGKLDLQYNSPAQSAEGDTPGDVLLMADADIIFLFGKEALVRTLTGGRFALGLRRRPTQFTTTVINT